MNPLSEEHYELLKHPQRVFVKKYLKRTSIKNHNMVLFKHKLNGIINSKENNNKYKESNVYDVVKVNPVLYPTSLLRKSTCNQCQNLECLFVEYLSVFHPNTKIFRLGCVNNKKHCIICDNNPGFINIQLTNKGTVRLKKT